MNKRILSSGIAVILGASTIGFANSRLPASVNDFVAPTVNGKGNITAPQVGTIIYDIGANQFFAKDSSASGWQPISSGTTASISSVYVKDIETSSTNGGTCTSGAWRTRTLNTLENPLAVSWVSISGNQITLEAGTYEIVASAPGYFVTGHQAKLRNITDSSDTIVGTSEYSAQTGTGITTRSFVIGTFTIAGQKTFEIQHQCASTEANVGFGQGLGFTSEVYTVAKITKVN